MDTIQTYPNDDFIPEATLVNAEDRGGYTSYCLQNEETGTTRWLIVPKTLDFYADTSDDEELVMKMIGAKVALFERRVAERVAGNGGSY